VVLVNARPAEGETWSMGFKALLPTELATWGRRRRSSSRCGEVRWEPIPGEGLGLGIGHPGLRCTGSKLAELRRRQDGDNKKVEKQQHYI